MNPLMKPLIENTRNTTRMKTTGMAKIPIRILTHKCLFFFARFFLDMPGFSRLISLRSALSLFCFLRYSRFGEVVLPFSSQKILYFLQ